VTDDNDDGRDDYGDLKIRRVRAKSLGPLYSKKQIPTITLNYFQNHYSRN